MNKLSPSSMLRVTLAWASPIACLLFALHELWLRHPAYHFVPLPLIVMALLLKKDQRGLLAEGQWMWLTKGLVLAHFALAAAGFVLLSPFFAGMAFCVAMLAYAAGYPRTTTEDPPRWAFPGLALFFVPPPLMLDHDLHQVMAGLAARLSQGWLDAMQLLHVVEGTIVVTPEKRFFVDDACSGTNSLLTICCVALIIGALRRRSWQHGLLLLTTAALMSIASNVLRICVVIGSSHFYGVALDKGASHQALGFAFFVFDLLLVSSADLGLKFLLHRLSAPSRRPVAAGQPFAPVASLWPTPVSAAIALIGLCFVLGPSMLARSASDAVQTRLDSSLQSFEMPAELAGWKRKGERAAENAVIGNLGVRNQVWIYERDGQEAYVAVNFPFTGFHDTRLCYSGQGWQLHSQTDLNPPGESGSTVRFVEMSQPADLLQAHLWLSVFDERGLPQEFPPENLVERVNDRLVGRWMQPTAPANTTVVLQLLVMEPGSAAETRSGCLELLAASRQWLSSTLARQQTTTHAAH